MSVAGSLGVSTSSIVVSACLTHFVFYQAIAVHTAYVILLHGRPVGKCVGIGVTGGIWFVVVGYVKSPSRYLYL